MGTKKTTDWTRLYRFEQWYLKFGKAQGRAPTEAQMRQAGFPTTTVRTYFGKTSEVYKYMVKKYPDRMIGIPASTKPGRQPSARKEEIAKGYAQLTKKLGRVPTLAECETPETTVRRFFQTHRQLCEYARANYPQYFFDTGVDALNTRKQVKQLDEVLRGTNRFVITTAVEGCQVDTDFLASITTYCEQNNAKLLVLMCSDPASRGYGTTVDKRIPAAGSLVLEDTALNNNLFLSTIKVSAKQIEPLTGLLRVGQRNGSMILAAPKQHLKYVATANEKLPHALMTTGAVTLPNYETDQYMSERTAYIACHDHVVGALIVEVQDDTIFHFRQIQADSRGRFIDLGVEYAPKGIKRDYPPEAIVLGDWHSGSTNKDVERLLYSEMCPLLKPKSLVLHDFFDGMSINHHEAKKLLTRAKRAECGQTSLSQELDHAANDLKKLKAKTGVDDIWVVKSNHDVFLHRYLDSGLFVKDAQNIQIATQLVHAALTEGQDPLRAGLEFYAGGPIPGVHWLELNDDFQIGGVQLAAHGHLGPNGARSAGLKSMEQAYGQCVIGHSHTPGIIRGAWQVGTSSDLRLSYNDGPSSWLHTHCLVYKNGARQLINIIDGQWRVK